MSDRSRVSRKFEPYTPSRRAAYEAARRLLEDHFLPLLRETHNVPPDGELTPAACNDLRLVKTLILAALVPSVESLRSLDARRLAALNHGTIRTDVPGPRPGRCSAGCNAGKPRWGS